MTSSTLNANVGTEHAASVLKLPGITSLMLMKVWRMLHHSLSLYLPRYLSLRARSGFNFVVRITLSSVFMHFAGLKKS